MPGPRFAPHPTHTLTIVVVFFCTNRKVKSSGEILDLVTVGLNPILRGGRLDGRPMPGGGSVLLHRL